MIIPSIWRAEADCSLCRVPSLQGRPLGGVCAGGRGLRGALLASWGSCVCVWPVAACDFHSHGPPKRTPLPVEERACWVRKCDWVYSGLPLPGDSPRSPSTESSWSSPRPPPLYTHATGAGPCPCNPLWVTDAHQSSGGCRSCLGQVRAVWAGGAFPWKAPSSCPGHMVRLQKRKDRLAKHQQGLRPESAVTCQRLCMDLQVPHFSDLSLYWFLSHFSAH